MTDIKPKAQAVKDAVTSVYKDDWCKKAGWEIDKPTIITALKEVINQLGYTHLYVDGDHGLGVVNIRDIMSVIEELENL